MQSLLKEMDPEGTKLRRSHLLKRREYLNPGPNHCWHADGYDKLKPFGFPIHGCIDGFSRRIMWLEITRSNNNPHLVGKLFLDCIKGQQGLPNNIKNRLGNGEWNYGSRSMLFKAESFRFIFGIKGPSARPIATSESKHGGRCFVVHGRHGG